MTCVTPEMCIRHNCALGSKFIVVSSGTELLKQRVRTGDLRASNELWRRLASFDDFLLRRTPAVAAHAEVGADKGLQIAVNHPVHIADFSLGAVIFNEPIGLQDVGADL